MIHQMTLQPEPFELIASGNKTIELRLYDEKRRLIHTGDRIIFRCCTDRQKQLVVEVIALYPFGSFRELYEKLPLLQCGYTVDNVMSASPEDMLAYYPLERQKLYGVLGIEIRLV